MFEKNVETLKVHSLFWHSLNSIVFVLWLSVFFTSLKLVTVFKVKKLQKPLMDNPNITFDTLISVSLVVVSRTCTFAFRSQTIFSFCFASQPESSSRSHLHNEQTIVAKTDLTFITIFLPSERQRGLKGRESSHDQKELRCCVVDGDFLLPITRPRWMQPLSVHRFFSPYQISNCPADLEV